MNIRDLKYLVALEDHCHFGKAADACFVSQPALSMQIKKLENSLGVQLLERTNKSVMLTQLGKTIAKQARSILNQVDNIYELANQAKDPLSGEFRLGVIPTLAPYLLPHIIPGLSKHFPKLTIYLVEEQTSHLMTKLLNGKLDGALLALPIIEENLVSFPLFEEEFMLAVSSHHDFAKRKKAKHTDLENKSLLLLDDGHCLREQALAICHRIHAKEASYFQATSLETLRHMVAANSGITLMPKLSCKMGDGIVYIPFHSPKPSRTIGLIGRRATAKVLLFENLVAQIRKLLLKNSLIKVINTSSLCCFS